MLASPAAWDGLEEYLRTGLRARLRSVVSGVVLEAVGAGDELPVRGTGSGGSASGCCGSVTATSSSRRSWTSSATPWPRGPTRRRRRCCAAWTRWPSTAWTPCFVRSASSRLRRWSISTRVWARRSSAPASGCGIRPTRRQSRRSSSPGTTPAIRPRSSTRPATRWATSPAGTCELAQALRTHARAALGGAGGDVGELGQRGGRRRVRVRPRRVGRRCRRWPTSWTARTAAVYRIIPGDPHPFAWVRVPVQRRAVPQLVRPWPLGSGRGCHGRHGTPPDRAPARSGPPGEAERRRDERHRRRRARVRRCGRSAGGR